MNESCHTCEWVMSHVWMSHVTRVNESCHTCEWVMSHVWMRLVTYWKCHVTHTNVICTGWEWVMLHIYCSILFVGFDSLCDLHYWPRVTWLIYMTNSHVRMSHVKRLNSECLARVNESCCSLKKPRWNETCPHTKEAWEKRPF